jgi:hypothetical protein
VRGHLAPPLACTLFGESKLKNILIFIIILFTFLQCKKNSSEPETELQYWTTPTLAAVVISYRHSDSVRLDSIFAGEIQFRLDVARTVDEQLIEYPVWKDWVLGDISLWTTDELYSNFDTTTSLFNHKTLDSVLTHFEVREIEKGSDRFKKFRLDFPEYYNMRVLSEIISDIEGIISAEVNIYGMGGGCKRDIKLEIEEKLYKFTFSGKGLGCDRSWEIHILDNQVEYVNSWD